MGPIENYLNKPLTQREEARLSTLGNCVTLACFRPLDTFKIQCVREKGKLRPSKLWQGWSRQVMGKIIDDELFNANIRRVTKFVEETFNVKNPSSTVYGKAAVATIARSLTLCFMTPYQHLSDPVRRRALVAKKGKGSKADLINIVPLYGGFESAVLKEGVFTSSYILLSAYFNNMLWKHRDHIISHVDKYCTKASDEKKNKVADVTIMSMKAAAAGACATVLSQPLENIGKGVPATTQISRVTRKAIRKGVYNGINTVIVQALCSYKIHRRLFWNIAFDDSNMSESKIKA